MEFRGGVSMVLQSHVLWELAKRRRKKVVREDGAQPESQSLRRDPEIQSPSSTWEHKYSGSVYLGVNAQEILLEPLGIKPGHCTIHKRTICLMDKNFDWRPRFPGPNSDTTIYLLYCFSFLICKMNLVTVPHGVINQINKSIYKNVWNHQPSTPHSYTNSPTY